MPRLQGPVASFLGLISALENETIDMEFIEVDRNKEDGLGLVQKMNVSAIPTFIILRNGKELGKIVERPKVSLERDMAEIVS